MKKHLLVVGIILLFILSSVSPLAFGVNNQISKSITSGNTLYVGGSGVQSRRGEEVIAFHNGNITNGICLTGPIYEGAIRITPDELGSYNGWLLIGVRFYFWENVTHGGEIKIYDEGIDTSPGALIASEPCNFSGIGWRRTNLSTPVLLDASKDIWFSYRTNDPWACCDISLDTGPAVHGKGDWLYFCDEWLETRLIGSDYNWGLEAIVRNGNTLYVGGSGPGNYSDIQSAINDANSGDTVFVYSDSSPYIEDVIVDKSINLIGEDKDTTVIKWTGWKEIIKITADWVNITGFTISNCGWWEASGILVLSNNTTIIDCNLISNYVCGIQLYNSNNNIIASNNFYDNWFSIYLINSDNNTITGSVFLDNVYCIILEDSCWNTIMDNSNSKGIHGTNLDNSSNNTITGNIFKKRLWLSDSVNNIIYHNNFINKAYDDNNNTWDDGYPSGGNYWDDYNGTDEDEDGIGDTPHLIPGGDNEDRYPLMYPTVNFPPDSPIINGLNSGKPNTEYDFSFNSTDPNDDAVMYIIDWGDNTTDWTEYGDSGEEIILKHTWSEKGTFVIKAKAEDIYGAESEWGELEVNMPRNKAINTPFLNWLQSHPNMFPMLQLLLQLLGLQ